MNTPQGPQPYRHNQPPPQYRQPLAPPHPGQQPNPYGQPGEGIGRRTGGARVRLGTHARCHPARPAPRACTRPYFLPSRLGPADATADVRPGQVAELEYKAPLWSFSAGALGVGPQKYNGVGITLAVVAIPFILPFLVILLTIVVAAI
jgi:hypothetical protein